MGTGTTDGDGTDHGPENMRAVRDDLALGEWLRDGLIDLCGLDDHPWTVDLVWGVAGRLNAVRAPAPPLEPVVLWVAGIGAFIGPGRYLYVTRGLLLRAWWEDAVAFTVAHEMAHHDLGHTRVFHGRWGWARRLPGFLGVAVLLALPERWLNGPEREAAADARALDLCLAAGYDGHRCLELFDMFEAYALDHGDIDGVFGPDEPPEPRAGLAGWLAAAQGWRWQRLRGYPSIRARKAALLARLAKIPQSSAAPLGTSE